MVGADERNETFLGPCVGEISACTLGLSYIAAHEHILLYPAYRNAGFQRFFDFLIGSCLEAFVNYSCIHVLTSLDLVIGERPSVCSLLHLQISGVIDIKFSISHRLLLMDGRKRQA